MSSDYYGSQAGEIADEGPDDDWDDEPCEHEHDEECYDYNGFDVCLHQHCMNCGGCTCPGYCDDYVTYNLRPDETGGKPETEPDDSRDTPDRTPLGESSW